MTETDVTVSLPGQEVARGEESGSGSVRIGKGRSGSGSRELRSSGNVSWKSSGWRKRSVRGSWSWSWKGSGSGSWSWRGCAGRRRRGCAGRRRRGRERRRRRGSGSWNWRGDGRLRLRGSGSSRLRGRGRGSEKGVGETAGRGDAARGRETVGFFLVWLKWEIEERDLFFEMFIAQRFAY